MLSLAAALASHDEELAPMVADPIVFAVIAATIFLVLGLVTYSFRDVANRHRDKASNTDHQSSQH